jgi:hypothetical protein
MRLKPAPWVDYTADMRLALGFMLACSGLLAQSGAVLRFRQLATTDDGSRLYFASPSPLAGTNDTPYSKIFVFGSQGLHVFAQQSPYALGWPSASGPGDVVAFTVDGASAAARFQANLALANGAVFWTTGGRAAISRNARFALFVSDGSSGAGTATVLDLQDLASYQVETDALSPVSSGRGIASDGTAVVLGSGTIRIVRASGVISYPAQGTPNSAAIDDNAARVAYEAQDRIILLDLASGAESVLAGNGARPSLSNDGQLLLYLAPDANGVAQAWTVQADGGGAQPLTAEDAGITEAVLSGDGSTAYAIVHSARILRIDLASGQVSDLTTVIASAAPDPPRVVSLTASGGQLCYQVENARTISIQPEFGVVPGPSACLTAHPAMTTTYTLTATNDGGSATASATVDVSSVQITSFSNDPAYSPIAGGPVTLTWTTQNAVSVTMTGLGLPGGALPVNGSVVVKPVTNTSYTLIAYGANGQAVTSVLYIFVR